MESESEAVGRVGRLMVDVSYLLPEHDQSSPVAPAIANERHMMPQDITSFIAALALLILYAVTSIRIAAENEKEEQ